MAITITKTLPTGYIAQYARVHSSPSLRLDVAQVELTVALYKDADARFAKAEPCGFDRHNLKLSDSQRETITKVLYEAMADSGLYADGEVRDPDPEKIIPEEPAEEPKEA